MCYFKRKFIRNLKCRFCSQSLSLIHNISVTNLLRRKCFAALCHERLLVVCVCVCVHAHVRTPVSCSVVSNSTVSARFPCPWDSPGKNTEVGCHFLLQVLAGRKLFHIFHVERIRTRTKSA